MQNISGLSIALDPSSTYEIEVVLMVMSNDNDDKGTNYAINYTGTGTHTISALMCGTIDDGAGGHYLCQRITALNTSPSNNYCEDQNLYGGVNIKGTITTGSTAGGNLVVRHKSIRFGKTSTVYKGSYLKVTKIS